jgi:hypothetical protein
MNLEAGKLQVYKKYKDNRINLVCIKMIKIKCSMYELGCQMVYPTDVSAFVPGSVDIQHSKIWKSKWEEAAIFASK